MNKNLTPRNDKGQPHGYWEWYYSGNNKIGYKCYWVNGRLIGYDEDYTHTGGIDLKTFWIR